MEQTVREAMEMSKEIRIRVLEGVNAEQDQFAEQREEQVKLSQDERSKINFLAFAIVGSVLGFSPSSLQSPWVIVGLGIILFNAFLFGFVADAIQRNHNIKNAEGGIMDVRNTVKPYFDAYDEAGQYLDDPNFRPEVFQERYNKLQNAYTTYLEEHKKKNEKPRLAKRTKLGIGYWYFVLFAFGLVVMGYGLIQVN